MSKGCLIIGLGQIGMEYDMNISAKDAIYTHARAFSMHPSFELIGAVDPSEDKRSKFIEIFKKPAFKDISESLKNLNPEIVVISTSLPTKPTFQLSEFSSQRIVELVEAPLCTSRPAFRTGAPTTFEFNRIILSSIINQAV